MEDQINNEDISNNDFDTDFNLSNKNTFNALEGKIGLGEEFNKSKKFEVKPGLGKESSLNELKNHQRIGRIERQPNGKIGITEILPNEPLDPPTLEMTCFLLAIHTRFSRALLSKFSVEELKSIGHNSGMTDTELNFLFPETYEHKCTECGIAMKYSPYGLCTSCFFKHH